MKTIEAERHKYRRMWDIKAYRATSPGERLVSVFKANVPYKKGDSLIDCGCGPGRAAFALGQLGLRVSCLDIAENCLDEAVRESPIPFIEGCLWALPPVMPEWDWFYCTDVMEHLPEEHIGSALDNIRRLATKGGMFQIAMFDDPYGAYIGETLHLTIKPLGWWLPRLQQLWKDIKILTPEPRRFVAIVGV